MQAGDGVFFSAPNVVTVFHQRGLTGGGHMMANRSTDGGLNFGARNRTGVAFSNSAAPDEAVYGPGNTITAVCFTTNSQRLITASGDKTCAQWDVGSGEELKQVPAGQPCPAHNLNRYQW